MITSEERARAIEEFREMELEAGKVEILVVPDDGWLRFEKDGVVTMLDPSAEITWDEGMQAFGYPCRWEEVVLEPAPAAAGERDEALAAHKRETKVALLEMDWGL